MNYGHIKLSRKLFDGSDMFWPTDRPFTTFEAWIDIIRMAAWHNVSYVTARGCDPLTRGEFVAANRYLAERWQWSKSTVNRFLALCKKVGRITGQRKGQHSNVYLIVNYDAYQTGNSVGGTENGTASGTEMGHSWDTRGTKTNTGKARKAVTTGLDAAAGDCSPEFMACWAAYPKRSGGNSRRDAHRAWTARRGEGFLADDLLAGTRRYAAFAAATGKAGTEFVMQGQRFYGPSLMWMEPWDVPSSANGSAPPASPFPRDSLADAVLAEQAGHGHPLAVAVG